MAYIVKRRLKGGQSAYLVRYHGPNGRTHSRQFAKRVDADRFANTTEVAKHDGSWIDTPVDASLDLSGRWIDPQDDVTDPRTILRRAMAVACVYLSATMTSWRRKRSWGASRTLGR